MMAACQWGDFMNGRGAVTAAVFATALFAAFAFAGCDDHYDLDDQARDSLGAVRVDQSFLRDEYGRYVYLSGANVSGSTKFPASTDPVSYVGKPFDLEEADHHFTILRSLGFNVLRLLVIWEGVQPDEPDTYDEEYVDYVAEIARKAGEHGLYVFLDMHQDFFSRHLFSLYDDLGDTMDLYDAREIALAERFGFNNRVGGDGAPEWAVQLCLPDKFVGGSEWGRPFWAVDNPRTTSDVIPLSLWGINIFTSLDVNRCFATMLAGKEVYPNYVVEGRHVEDVLQEAYAGAWVELVRRVKDLPNVIGYDLMNEPAGLFIRLPIDALLYQEAKSAPGGKIGEERAMEIVGGFFASLIEDGFPEADAEMLTEVLTDYAGVPTSVEELEALGFGDEKAFSPYRPDLGASISINSNFNRNHLQPFYERVSSAILAEDPDAIIFMEQALGAMDKGIAGQWAQPMTHLAGVDQMVYAPHFYTDIYPFLGINVPPREYTIEEKRHRDYLDDILGATDAATFSLGNPPVLMGEFGTYFNFGGIEESMANDYVISTLVLNPYYEAYEQLLMHRTVWCYSPENTAEEGEGWNKEDFSILGPDGEPRSWEAYARPAPRATSGRIRNMHYYSPVHYFEPRPGEQTPYREFVLEMDGIETNAPTEIAVPPRPYPDGFHVEVSDGRCDYDPERFVVYWYPSDDDPAAVHRIRVTPPYPSSGNGDWNYFFKGDQVIER